MGNKVFLTVLLAGLLACPVTVLTAAQPPEQPPELVAEEVAERAAEKAIEKAEAWEKCQKVSDE